MTALSDPRRLFGNLLQLGAVKSVDLARATCRVRVGELVTGDLPWLTPRAGATRLWSPPVAGEQVLLLCREGDVEGGLVLPALFSDAHPAPASDKRDLITCSDGANTAVIGGTVNGSRTGLQALLAAEPQLGVRPRILGAPGLDTLPVAAALAVVADKLRGFAYAAAQGADVAAATKYRANFESRRLMLVYADFLAFDPAVGAAASSPAVARALGLRARIDQETGWHKTLSNVPVKGVLGLTKDVGFDVQDSGHCSTTSRSPR